MQTAIFNGQEYEYVYWGNGEFTVYKIEADVVYPEHYHTKSNGHKVNARLGHCNCADHYYRKRDCKHILMCRGLLPVYKPVKLSCVPVTHNLDTFAFAQVPCEEMANV